MNATPRTQAVIDRAMSEGKSLHEAGLTDLCRELERAISDTHNSLRAAEDYVTHAPNWPLGTRIAKRKEVLALLRAALAGAPK